MNPIKQAMIYLTELADSKQQIRNDIVHEENNIIEHLLKCFLYKNSTGDYNHWKKEIYSFLNRIPKLRGSNKFPSHNILKKFTIDRFGDVLKDWIPHDIRAMVVDGYPKIEDYNIEELYNAIIDYYEWLIKELSSNGKVENIQVYNKIDELTNKF